MARSRKLQEACAEQTGPELAADLRDALAYLEGQARRGGFMDLAILIDQAARAAHAKTQAESAADTVSGREAAA